VVVSSGRMSGASGFLLDPDAKASGFLLDPDAKAREWLQSHPSTKTRVIAYDVHRCCGGGKICLVTVRDMSETDDPNRFVAGSTEDGPGSSSITERRRDFQCGSASPFAASAR